MDLRTEIGDSIPESFDDHMMEELGSSAAVDPDLFLTMCEELEVWDECDLSTILERMEEVFEGDSISATGRFLDLAVCWHDGTVAEFQWTTDEDLVATPDEVILAAATCPFDGTEMRLDRPQWRREIARLLSLTEI